VKNILPHFDIVGPPVRTGCLATKDATGPCQ
jgi:hypothetical protein